jgi:hypothetical protein
MLGYAFASPNLRLCTAWRLSCIMVFISFLDIPCRSTLYDNML